MLLPEVALARRQDEVAVIGSAIEAKVVAGEGFRRIAARLGAYPETVRGWLRRFAERAELIRAHFTRCAVVLDPELGPVMPAGSDVADALDAIAVARAWVLRFGPADSWQIASRLSGGMLLALAALRRDCSGVTAAARKSCSGGCPRSVIPVRFSGVPSRASTTAISSIE